MGMAHTLQTLFTDIYILLLTDTDNPDRDVLMFKDAHFFIQIHADVPSIETYVKELVTTRISLPEIWFIK